MQSIIPFLKKLKKNNNRSWFEEHKGEYEKARAEFLAFTTEFIAHLKKADKAIGDPDPAKTIFRIYRDVRFSKDKTPYKTHLSANINPGGKKVESPGYYFQIAPGDCFLAAGIWMPEPEKLAKIRQELDYHFPEFKKILKEKNFKKYYGELYEEGKAKNPPRGFDKENPAIELLKNRNFIVIHNFDEKNILSKTFPKKLAEIAKYSLPLNKFLRKAID
jgi:uncharacterized protein (TIGR02453 family)